MVSKYGKAELRALVQSGAIATMRNPKDPNYWLFKDEIIQEKVETKQEKGISGERQSNIDAKDFLLWARQDLSGMSGEDMFGWDQGALKDVSVEPEDDGNGKLPKNLQGLLGIKDKDPNSAHNQKRLFERELDTMTNVPDDIKQDKLLKRLNQVKGLADKVVDEWRVAKQGDKKGRTDLNFKQACMLRSKLDEFLWEDDLNAKKGSLKKVMTELAGHLKELKTKMMPDEGEEENEG